MAGSVLMSSLLLMACVLLPLCAAQASCRGRCGELFTRGQSCTCDQSCLSHSECCKDYVEVCTSSGSCRGRCGESFQRGRECECDPDCVLYNTCCSDYTTQCAFLKTKPQTDFQAVRACMKPLESESEERSRVFLNNPAAPDALAQGPVAGVVEHLSELLPLTEDLMTPTGAPLSLNPSLYPPVPPQHAAHTPVLVVPAAEQPQSGASPAGKPLTIPIQVSLSISGHAGGAAGGPAGGSAGGAAGGPAGGPAAGAPLQLINPEAAGGRPSTLTDIAEALGLTNPAALPSESSSPDLCSALPIDALTSLFNGSIIVFKGHFFWLLDPKTRAAGPAQSISEVLGVPSPIDTAFTRCNCQGKTYIIKGDQYWVFENGVMEAGYPRSVSQDFDGLSGEITAALSVPATRKKPEAIYFFKKGGTVQKFTYPAGSSPNCSGKKVKNSVYIKIRHARQAELRLSAEININLNWKGFPTPVTSALSAPNPRKPDGFDYFIISWPKLFNIKISGEFPTLASAPKPPAQQMDIRTWLNCP